jgi:iron complex transport system substrate-binding protein
MKQPRIVSLISSATEIVCALGFRDQLVGRSHECDYPESVKSLPVCTAPKFDVHGSSSEIDQRVKAILQEATSVYRVDADLLKKLRPDIIVTQTQCEVCAVSQSDVEDALFSWLDHRPQVLSLAPNNLDDVWDNIRQVATALDVAQKGQSLALDLQSRTLEIATRTPLVAKPTVACLEWLDPLMAAGNWVPELVALAGGINLFGTAGKHSPWMTWQELVEREPDVIVALPCGFDLAKTRSEMAALTRRSEWEELNAVRRKRVYVTDGNQFFNRPGPRLLESLQILAEIFHPREFSFGHEGSGWQVFP